MGYISMANAMCVGDERGMGVVESLLRGMDVGEALLRRLLLVDATARSVEMHGTDVING